MARLSLTFTGFCSAWCRVTVGGSGSSWDSWLFCSAAGSWGASRRSCCPGASWKGRLSSEMTDKFTLKMFKTYWSLRFLSSACYSMACTMSLILPAPIRVLLPTQTMCFWGEYVGVLCLFLSNKRNELQRGDAAVAFRVAYCFPGQREA